MSLFPFCNKQHFSNQRIKYNRYFTCFFVVLFFSHICIAMGDMLLLVQRKFGIIMYSLLGYLSRGVTNRIKCDHEITTELMVFILLFIFPTCI